MHHCLSLLCVSDVDIWSWIPSQATLQQKESVQPKCEPKTGEAEETELHCLNEGRFEIHISPLSNVAGSSRLMNWTYGKINADIFFISDLISSKILSNHCEVLIKLLVSIYRAEQIFCIHLQCLDFFFPPSHCTAVEVGFFQSNLKFPWFSQDKTRNVKSSRILY